jgi:GT2 family glycosyltransferase
MWIVSEVLIAPLIAFQIYKGDQLCYDFFSDYGGIRGGSEKIGKFQPRSFNMGLSRKAFDASKGFGNIHPGEDPDLSIRLWNLGFETKLFTNAYVYHKRRIDWDKFSVQVNKFGKARPILNSWYPKYSKLTFFPSFSLLLLIYDSGTNVDFNVDLLLKLYFIYFFSSIYGTYQNKSFKIGYLSVAVWKQFYGYGLVL